MKKRCRSCSKTRDVREIEIEGFKKAYFCQTCHPKAMRVIALIQKQEGCTFEEAKVLFGKLQVKIKNDKTWGKRIIRQAERMKND